MAEVISANGVLGRNGNNEGGPGSDPVKEICDLKSQLAGVITQRNDLKKAYDDVADEMGELRAR